MTISEMISVLIAHKSGKPIETRVKGGNGNGAWVGVSEPLFNFEKQEYRVRPNYLNYRVGVNKVNNIYVVFIITELSEEQVAENNRSFLRWETEWRTINE